MDQQSVRKLEDEIAKAIAGVMMRNGLKPPRLSQRTMHLMAKAAVAVYEAVATDEPPIAED